MGWRPGRRRLSGGQLGGLTMFRNVLVAYDGSAQSERALREAIDIADRGNGRLTILTACGRSPRWAVLAPEAMAGAKSVDEELQARAHQFLRRAAGLVPARLPLTTMLTLAPIPRAVLERVAEHRHDLIVMAGCTSGTRRATLLGGASREVLQRSPVSVLIVHGDDGCMTEEALTPARPAVGEQSRTERRSRR